VLTAKDIKSQSHRMAQTLRDILAEFVGKPPGDIDIVIIHLRRAVEREENIKKLLEACGTSMTIFPAIDGSESNHPSACATEPGKIRTKGEIGCLLSHVAVARKALDEGKSHIMVFEDDCIPVSDFSLEMVSNYLSSIKNTVEDFDIEGTKDFLLLGTCGCYNWRYITAGVNATNKFNGSHCYLIGRTMMEKLVGSYEYITKKGFLVPVDGLLGFLLKAQTRWALCPENDSALFIQNRAIPSYILGDGETLREE